MREPERLGSFFLRSEVGNNLVQVHTANYRHNTIVVSMGLSAKLARMTFGARIRDLRLTLGLTQVQLAKRAEITQGSLSAIERNNTKGLKAGTILALAKALGTSPQWLQTGRGSPGEPITPDPDEVEAYHILRALSPASRSIWLSNGRWLLAEESAKPSKAHPFKTTAAKAR